MQNRISASIVIRTKDEGGWIGQCLKEIFAQTVTPHEVIVVDSGSTDQTVRIARSFDVILQEIPASAFSYGRALNIGFSLSHSDFLVSLSAHAIPTDSRWLFYLLSPFANPKVGGVYGRQLPHPNSNPFEARAYDQVYGPDPKIQSNDPFFSSANCAIRRKLWEQFRFDESVSGAEDQLWAQQIQHDGYFVAYEPRAVVFHSHSEGLREVYRRAFRELRVLRRVREMPALDFRKFLRVWLLSSIDSFAYALRKKYFRWIFYAPFYEFFRHFGYYRALRE